MQGITLTHVLDAINATALDVPCLNEPVSRIHLDSRTLQPGDLFWAVAGENHDGHQFVTSAREHGAIASVISAEQIEYTSGPRLVVPTDISTIHSLGKFARWYRQQRDAFVVGITGSVGKTTTRQMVHTVLSRTFSGVASPRNYNNQFGVPLSLFQLEPEHEFAVLELGASRPGEIRELSHLASPDVGILTRIAPAHLETFGSIEQIQETKGELLEALPSTGFAILNGDDPLVREIAHRANCRVIFVGEQSENQVQARDIHQENNELRFSVHGMNYRLPVSGRHHLTSALAAITLGEEIGISSREIAAGLEAYQPVTGRSQTRMIGAWTVIDDTYNASPAAVSAACQLLGDWQTEHKRLLILGDMLELGEQSSEFHREMGQRAANHQLDFLISFGEFAEEISTGARTAGMKSCQLAACSNRETLETVLGLWLSPGDVVLVKGSRGLHMEQVIAFLEERAQEHSYEDISHGHLPHVPSRKCA